MDSVRMVDQRGQGGNEDVIHVDDNTGPLCEKAKLNVFEDLIHHGLKGTWRISQTKEHDSWFKETIFGLKCRFFFITSLDSNIVISPSYVELGEDICVLHLTDEIGDERQGVAVSNGEFIQP